MTSVMNVERFEIEPGYDISRLVKGGWHLAGGHGRIDRAEAVRDMAAFVEVGITTSIARTSTPTASISSATGRAAMAASCATT